MDQTLVSLDDPESRRLLPRIHASVDIVLTPQGRNVVERWTRALSALHDAVDRGRLRAVHVHGFMPSLLAPYVLRWADVKAPLYYSPHGSHAIGKLRPLGRFLWWLSKPVYSYRLERNIANARSDVHGWEVVSCNNVELIESPVSQSFFEVERAEKDSPVVMTGSRLASSRGADVLAQLAVLLSGEDLGLRFEWIGTEAPIAAQRLKAAGVGVRVLPDERDRARQLAQAWMYFAPSGVRGFPSYLVEAMAVGLPCIAADTPYHRDLIQDGVTGFLCETVEEVVERIAMLIDSRALRQKLGLAARSEAERRFSDVQFRDSLFAAYDLPPSRPAGL